MTWNGSYKLYDKTAFTNGLVVEQFHREIAAASFGSANFQHIRGGATQIAVQFDVEPDAADKSALDALQAAHPDPAFEEAPVYDANAAKPWSFRKSYTVAGGDDGNNVIDYVENSLGVWKSVSSFEFPGTDRGADVSSAKAVLSGSGSGTVRIRVYDVNNRNTIVEYTATVTQEAALFDLGALANIPTGEAVWEVQIRKQSKDIRLHSVTIQ